jgi:DNA-binding HxlR family transcriptional regulator
MERTKRRYLDACGTAHALDLIGERWALLVMRELMLGPRRFSDIKASLPGISANVLTQRLEGLEAAGIVARRELPPPASVRVYELTPWGLEAEPILSVMGRWAARSPLHDPTLPFSTASLVLSLRTMFSAERAEAEGFRARIALLPPPDAFVAEVSPEGLTIERGDPSGATASLAGSAESIAAAIHGGVPFEALESEGVLAVGGDRAAAATFTTLFPLPPKAG